MGNQNILRFITSSFEKSAGEQCGGDSESQENQHEDDDQDLENTNKRAHSFFYSAYAEQRTKDDKQIRSHHDGENSISGGSII